MKQKLLTRSLRVILMLVAVFYSHVSFLTYAQEFTYNGILYSIISGESASVIRVYDQSIIGDVVIPERVQYNNQEYVVREISEAAFAGCSGLNSIALPNSITTIGSDAFDECTGLTSITLPNSLTSIGDDSFYDCSGLTSITIPKTVTSIGSNPFDGCTSLKSISVESGNSNYSSIDGVLFNKDITEIIAFPGGKAGSYSIPNSVTTISNGSFARSIGLTSISIPNSVTTINGGAFWGCTSLTSITIPNSVISIGSECFEGCTGLTSITLSNSLTSLEYGIFKGCTGLTSITIPNSVTNIDNGIFTGCTSLQSINVEPNNNMYSSHDGVLYYKDIAELIAFPAGRTGQYNIPNWVKTIGDSAFSGCSGLSSITIPNSVYNIGDYAFSGCTSLTSITIPNSVYSIGSSCFEDCTGLTSITLSNSLKILKDGLFSGCIGLTSITIPNSVLIIDNGVFTGCTSLQSINVEPENKEFSSLDGVLFNKNKTVLITFPSGRSGHYSLPDSVTSIGFLAFYGCENLRQLTIPASVNEIGDNVFGNCKLTLCILSENCNYSEYAFSGMDSSSHIIAYKNESIERAFLYSGYSGTYAFIDSNIPFLVSNVRTTLCTASLKIEKSPILYPENDYEFKFSFKDGNSGQIVSPDEYGEYKITGLLPETKYTTIITCYNSKTSENVGVIEYPFFTSNVEFDYRYTVSQTFIRLERIDVYCAEDEKPTRLGVEFDGNEYDFKDDDITFNNLRPDSYYSFSLYAYYGDKKYTKDFEEKTLSLDSITDTEAEPATIVGYYDLMGKRYDEPRHGFNIILYSDGTTRKVYINTAN